MAKGIPCKIKFYDANQVVELASSDNSENKSFVICDGDKAEINENTIELLPHTPGEKVYMTVDETAGYLDEADKLSKEDLIHELTQMAYSLNRTTITNHISELKDTVIMSLGAITGNIKSMNTSSLTKTAKALNELSAAVIDLVNLDLEYGPAKKDDDRR